MSVVVLDREALRVCCWRLLIPKMLKTRRRKKQIKHVFSEILILILIPINPHPHPRGVREVLHGAAVGIEGLAHLFYAGNHAGAGR